ncbi:unnamed protein product, partial [Adineta steineri]
MKRVLRFALSILSMVCIVLDGAHFRGGIISWRPLNSTVQGTTAQIQIHQ